MKDENSPRGGFTMVDGTSDGSVQRGDFRPHIEDVKKTIEELLSKKMEEISHLLE